MDPAIKERRKGCTGMHKLGPVEQSWPAMPCHKTGLKIRTTNNANAEYLESYLVFALKYR